MTGAGRILHVTQPAVTRLIRELEADLGLILFDRHATGLRPTQGALELFNDVEGHVESIRRIRETADRIRDRKMDRLRIAAMATLSVGVLPQAICRFRSFEPDTDFFIQSDVSFRIIEAVLRNEVDVGFATIPPEHQGIDHIPMPTTSAVCLIPRNHTLAGKASVDVLDLDRQPFVSLGTSSLLRLRLEAAMRFADVRPGTTIQTLYSNTVCSYVALGLGLAVTDIFSVMGADLSDIEIRPFSPDISFDFAAVFPRGHRSELAFKFARNMHKTVEASLAAFEEVPLRSFRRPYADQSRR